MNDLTDRMHRAAEGPPPGFGAADIARRVHRSRRRGRVAAAALLALVVVGASLAITRAVRDERGDDRTVAGPIGTAELTASPWVLTAIGGDPVVGVRPAWVSFGEDGSVIGDGGCGPFEATWRWNGDALDIEGLDGRPGGCDRLEGTSLVGTPELIVDVLADDPRPGPSEITSGDLRLRSASPEAAPPWIELMRFDELDPVVDPSAMSGRWTASNRSSVEVDEATIVGAGACTTPSPWSLSTDGLTLPACIGDQLGLTGTGPWEVRSYWLVVWVRDGGRLVALQRDQGTVTDGYEDLVGGRWVVRGLPGVQASAGLAWLELHDDGTVRGDNGYCGTFEGRWSVDGEVLTGHDLRGPERSSCQPPPLDLQADLGAGLRLGRPDGAADQLELHPSDGPDDGGEPWRLQRFDRTGRVATADDLVGMWEGQDAIGWGVTFAADGTVEISVSGCREVRPWSLTDGVLTIGDAADDDCQSGIVQLPLPADVDARIDGDTLWLSGEYGVVAAIRIA